jgi:hypothetical protein
MTKRFTLDLTQPLRADAEPPAQLIAAVRHLTDAEQEPQHLLLLLAELSEILFHEGPAGWLPAARRQCRANRHYSSTTPSPHGEPVARYGSYCGSFARVYAYTYGFFLSRPLGAAE